MQRLALLHPIDVNVSTIIVKTRVSEELMEIAMH